jgi:non-homologous end joining protein Ku
MELIEAKAEGNEIATPEEPERPAPVLDLMAALEASLARAQQDHPSSRHRPSSHNGAHARPPKRASA